MTNLFIVIGQLTFPYGYLYILIDSGVTHRFITCDIIKRLGFEPTSIDSICIKLFDGNKIVSDKILLGKIVNLRGRDMTIDLIVFDMFNFDMILNIDFFSWYGVEIDCWKKKVRFYLDDDEKFTFEEGNVLSVMVRNIKTTKCLSKGS